MVPLQSKQSKQISFAIPHGTFGLVIQKSIIVESGVAIISFAGQNPQDWTWDTLSFPVGEPCSETSFLSGIAAASPASFWSPMGTADGTASAVILPVGFAGQDSRGNYLSVNGEAKIVGPSCVAPPIGCAVDSATVSYSLELSQPVATLGLAIFGTSITLLRVSYTVHIVMGEKLLIDDPVGLAGSV